MTNKKGMSSREGALSLVSIYICIYMYFTYPLVHFRFIEESLSLSVTISLDFGYETFH